MPRAARGVLLIFIAAVLAWILYRWVLRRTFVPLADRSMAVLLERRFEGFQDSLITSVEMAGRGDAPSDIGREMLSKTEDKALVRMGDVRLRGVLNFRPLFIGLIGALGLLATMAGFYALNADGFEIGVQRLYLLGDAPWPRNAQIEIVGLEVHRANTSGRSQETRLATFSDRRAKVAKGASVRLIVQADANARFVPETCVIRYRTADGDRGRISMTRIGGVQGGYQRYQYDAKPFKDILTDVSFDVVGFDHRLPNHQIEVVDSPAVVDCQLDCVFPDYMVDEELSLWLPRTIPLTSGTQLPQGCQVTLRAETNKPLRSVTFYNPATEERLDQDIADEFATAFAYPVAELERDLNLEITLVDTDGIYSERPYRVYVAALPDEPPMVDVRLKGISTAVTPDVFVPILGTIEDDYGTERSWIRVAVNDGDPRDLPIVVESGAKVDTRIDFREQRSLEGGVPLKAEDQLKLVVQASDRYNLGSGPNVGSGDNYQLDVVTPDELLAILEAREIGLRRRFEQIVEETTETRDMLLRVQTEGPATSVVAEPGEIPNATADSDGQDESGEVADGKRVWSLRLLRSQQALLQSQKSAQETLGVAASFRDIREELITNRVDTEDRKARLQAKIADPLERIGGEMFPELDARLATLVQRLDGNLETLSQLEEDDPETLAAAEAAVQQANTILLAMNQILEDMLDLETYNELLDIVRSIIEEQKALINDTKKEQKKQVLDLLN
jgi:hypothetical protein